MANCEKSAVFFALGNSFLEASLLDQSAVPAVGSVVKLKERSLHVRSTEHCTRPCCANEPTGNFRVKEIRTFASDERTTLLLCQQGRHDEVPPNSLDQVLSDRQWEESICQRHEWCRLFDSYTLDGYLGLTPGVDGPPHFALVVDVEPLDS